MRLRDTLVRFLSLAAPLIPVTSPALDVDLVTTINGVRQEERSERFDPRAHGETCMDITGEFPGFRVESNVPNRKPLICFSHRKESTLTINNATFTSTEATNGEIIISFIHTFPAGPNGIVMARSRLFGFFSTPTGVGAPTGDRVAFSGYFIQNDNQDAIAAEPFDYTVGEDMESGVFELYDKKRYLVAGPRTLKGVLTIAFTGKNHKLTFPAGNGVVVDSGDKFEDKLDMMEIEPDLMGGELGLPGEPFDVPESEPRMPVGEADFIDER